ncbi:hypothetical protein [Stenotrophomonas geniculata]|uniref:hypothetical protein n=1 Tax=Stenotrophomonas geniculata TaxID=86188 RepID=UPI00070CB930|nr:hypothetical protein [Stenotrophomonas geniculata]KRG47078.1 hypothetical protein ARC63_04960 [Stenotrophomonas geniculata ATCC 19374 = JCM 13324]
MKIEDFWNAAFLAALHRLPVAQAKKEADLATDVCIDHWHANWENRSVANAPKVQDIDIGSVYKPVDGLGNAIRDLPRLWSADEKQGS